MSEKIKYWWSEDRQFFCILVNDGTAQAAAPLTRRKGNHSMASFECIKKRCYSPVACGGFGYCRELNFREGDDLSYYLGPSATSATSEQCAELQRTFKEAENDNASDTP